MPTVSLPLGVGYAAVDAPGIVGLDITEVLQASGTSVITGMVRFRREFVVDLSKGEFETAGSSLPLERLVPLGQGTAQGQGLGQFDKTIHTGGGVSQIDGLGEWQRISPAEPGIATTRGYDLVRTHTARLKPGVVSNGVGDSLFYDGAVTVHRLQRGRLNVASPKVKRVATVQLDEGASNLAGIPVDPSVVTMTRHILLPAITGIEAPAGEKQASLVLDPGTTDSRVPRLEIWSSRVLSLGASVCVSGDVMRVDGAGLRPGKVTVLAPSTALQRSHGLHPGIVTSEGVGTSTEILEAPPSKRRWEYPGFDAHETKVLMPRSDSLVLPANRDHLLFDWIP